MIIIILISIVFCIWSPLLYWALILGIKILGRKQWEKHKALEKEIGEKNLSEHSVEFLFSSLSAGFSGLFYAYFIVLVIIGIICTPIHFAWFYGRSSSQSDRPSVDEALASYSQSMADQ